MTVGGGGDVVVCSTCDSETNGSATICSVCQAELKPVGPLPPPPPPAVPEMEQQKCINPDCLLLFPAGRQRCPHCGERQTRGEGPFVSAGGVKRPLDDCALVIGREGDTVLAQALAALANADLISRRHCEVSLVDGEPHVRDLNSTNGTFVGEQRLAGDVMTKVVWGAEIQFGRSGPVMTINRGDVDEQGNAE